MAIITTWFTLGTVGMVAGTLVLVYGFRHVPADSRRLYALLVSIPGFAVLAYGVMALGYGGVPTSRTVVYLPRYVDWLFTTPINVLFLGLLAGTDRRTIAAATGLQAVTILLGLAGALLAPPASYGAFLAGSAAFAVVVYLLYVRIYRDARETLSDAGAGLFETLRNFVVVLWSLYPVIWLVSGTGMGVMDTETTTLVIAYLDVVSKVGFGLIALHGFAMVLETDESADGDPEAVRESGENDGPTDAPGAIAGQSGGAATNGGSR